MKQYIFFVDLNFLQTVTTNNQTNKQFCRGRNGTVGPTGGGGGTSTSGSGRSGKESNNAILLQQNALRNSKSKRSIKNGKAYSKGRWRWTLSVLVTFRLTARSPTSPRTNKPALQLSRRQNSVQFSRLTAASGWFKYTKVSETTLIMETVRQSPKPWHTSITWRGCQPPRTMVNQPNTSFPYFSASWCFKPISVSYRFPPPSWAVSLGKYTKLHIDMLPALKD